MFDNDLVFIPGGSFEMGDFTGDEKAQFDEIPVHLVEVPGFKIAKYPVTQQDWFAVMGGNPSFFRGDHLPVENVSFDDVQQFLQRLNELSGVSYRLPYEAEWEFSARNRGEYSLWSGTNTYDDLVQYSFFNKSSYGRTWEVGTKLPNSLGLHDMSGLVWEWCQDRYVADFYSYEGSSDYRGPSVLQVASNGLGNVIRGGSWDETCSTCRTFSRDYADPSSMRNDIGFRVALDV